MNLEPPLICRITYADDTTEARTMSRQEAVDLMVAVDQQLPEFADVVEVVIQSSPDPFSVN
jgi:hypothetical protein